MSENTIQLRNLYSLSGMKFFIPDYQRGYRWTESEVTKMLDDFKEFYKHMLDGGGNIGEFYCLQPIVVKKNSDVQGYEVIDGQQRLTTLYIILKYLENVRKVNYEEFEMFSIQYQTRLEFDSKNFLENISDKNIDESREYIDFFYMKKVYDKISVWFDKPENKGYKKHITDALLSHNIITGTEIDNAPNIRVIWYELNDDAESIDIFTRLNIGKIPLTNAELIKALLLRRGNFSVAEASMRQLQISSEWNRMEQRLQEDSLWYFICPSSWPFDYENRIEFIFDLMKKRTKDSEAYYTFNKFCIELDDLKSNNHDLNEQSRIEHIWDGVKQTFQTIDEWYENRELYHYIGYLIEFGADINCLIEESKKMKKNDFLEKNLKASKIKQTLQNINVEELSYNNYNDIKKVLLLFNIHTVLQSEKSDMRFPFYRYKKEHWDIEHICAQTDYEINNLNKRLDWIKDMLDFFVGKDDFDNINTCIEDLEKHINSNNKNNISNQINQEENELDILKGLMKLQENTDDTTFNEVYKKVMVYCHEDRIEDKDNIGNLTLLDAETNRSYKNAFFPIKRKRIINNDKQGVFVPIVTKNVFLKYYTHKGDNLMFWSKQDANDYLNAMKEIIELYQNKYYAK